MAKIELCLSQEDLLRAVRRQYGKGIHITGIRLTVPAEGGGRDTLQDFEVVALGHVEPAKPEPPRYREVDDLATVLSGVPPIGAGSELEGVFGDDDLEPLPGASPTITSGEGV